MLTLSFQDPAQNLTETYSKNIDFVLPRSCLESYRNLQEKYRNLQEAIDLVLPRYCLGSYGNLQEAIDLVLSYQDPVQDPTGTYWKNIDLVLPRSCLESYRNLQETIDLVPIRSRLESLKPGFHQSISISTSICVCK